MIPSTDVTEQYNGWAMTTMRANAPNRPYWITGNVCALAAGILTRILLASPEQNPAVHIAIPVVGRVAHYLFNPLTLIAVVVLFVVRIIQLKFIGVWSVFLAFMVGGMTSTLLLALLHHTSLL